MIGDVTAAVGMDEVDAEFPQSFRADQKVVVTSRLADGDDGLVLGEDQCVGSAGENFGVGLELETPGSTVVRQTSECDEFEI